MGKTKSINQYSLNGTYIATFKSVSEAARKGFGDQSNISKACKSIVRTEGGYQWRFTEDMDGFEPIPPVEPPPCSKKSVSQYDLDGNYIRTYPSISEAARAVGVSDTMINLCCHGFKPTARGFLWKLETSEAREFRQDATIQRLMDTVEEQQKQIDLLMQALADHNIDLSEESEKKAAPAKKRYDRTDD